MAQLKTTTVNGDLTVSGKLHNDEVDNKADKNHKQAYTTSELDTYTDDDNIGVSAAGVKKCVSTFALSKINPTIGGSDNYLTFKKDAGIRVNQATTSNYSDTIRWSGTKGEDFSGYGPEIGYHNTGNQIIILPYNTTTEPWMGTEGLVVRERELRFNNKKVATEDQVNSKLGKTETAANSSTLEGHPASDFLPVNNPEFTGIMTGSMISGETGDNKLYHSIQLGIPDRDYLDFNEYGGVFRFNKTNKDDTKIKIAEITEDNIFHNGNALLKRYGGYMADPDTLVEGIYTVARNTDNGYPASYGRVLVLSTNDNKTSATTWATQLFHSTDGKWYTRQLVNDGNWESWKTIAYTDQVNNAISKADNANRKAEEAISQITTVNQDKISKSDLTFSLSGTTLTITKK